MGMGVIYEVRGSSVITLSHEPGRPGIESRGTIFLTLHGSRVGSYSNAAVEKSSQQLLAAPPSDRPVTGSGRKHKTYSGVYQNLFIVL